MNLSRRATKWLGLEMTFAMYAAASVALPQVFQDNRILGRKSLYRRLPPVSESSLIRSTTIIWSLPPYLLFSFSLMAFMVAMRSAAVPTPSVTRNRSSSVATRLCCGRRSITSEIAQHCDQAGTSEPRAGPLRGSQYLLPSRNLRHHSRPQPCR
jgi:hypothetical protein